MPIYQIISRSQAKLLNQRRYFTNKPCQHGHVAQRLTSNGSCCKCNSERYQTNVEKYRTYGCVNRKMISERSKEWYANNKEYKAELNKRWQSNNKERSKKLARDWRGRNSSRRKEIMTKWRANNKRKIAAHAKKFRQIHSDTVAAATAKRRARKKNATPKWADYDKIKQIYSEAKQLTAVTGIPFQVDHVVPLTSDIVCGLHCEDNLQILTAKENNEKRNVFMTH